MTRLDSASPWTSKNEVQHLRQRCRLIYPIKQNLTALDPLIRQIVELVMRDEGRHVAFGVNYLEDGIKALPQQEIEDRAQFAYEACVFERMIPNLKRVGLLTEAVRPKFEALGVLKWEDAVHDGLIDWATLERPLPTKAVLAAE